MLITMRSIVIAAALVGGASIAYADTTTVRGGPVKSITIVRGSLSVDTTSTNFIDVPGAAAAIKVPAGSLVTARFSAESMCQGQLASYYCAVQIVAVKNGVTTILEPNSRDDFAFDSGDVNDFWESHSMDRSVVLAEAGKYQIQVQYGTAGHAETSFRLDDWSLTIETADAK